MNWSHFKPKFSGKQDEDVEAHLLRTNDWMATHDFPESVKVQRFCLTLVGEARNWYATLEPLAMTWPELQTVSVPIFQNRQYERTVVSQLEIISL